MSEDIIAFSVLGYILTALIGSSYAARILERRLKAEVPSTRPYVWGFYFGCLGIACAPVAVVSALAAVASWLTEQRQAAVPEKTRTLMLGASFFAAHAVCGWYIIRRKRWAWVIGTTLTANLVIWIINGAYASRRWQEFAGVAYGSKGTAEECYELLDDAIKSEAQGRIEEALALYRRLVEQHGDTDAGREAQQCIESVRAKIGQR